MQTIIKDFRAQYYEAPMPVQGLRQYHLSEQEIAGLWGTETCHPPHFNIPRHAHDLASFYIVLEGSLTEFYDRNQRDLRTCSVVFTPPGEIHRNAFHNAGGRCFLVELTPHWTDRLAASDIKLENYLDTTNIDLTLLATKLYKEFRYVDKVSALSVEGLALEILAAFSRQSESAPEGYLQGWLRNAKDLLHDRFSETITLDEIAEQVGVHPVHLARAFRRRYCCSLGEYQRRLRVEHASRQLVTTRCSLADIALAAGFADQAHFTRVFKKRTGLTPAKFRATFALS
ncbi:MAG TPA: AraC family transcriptional regulator [Blastocatellia bacterium]|nr:AraC family transcriptional regulator [Blastocatellia bacterium]